MTAATQDRVTGWAAWLIRRAAARLRRRILALSDRYRKDPGAFAGGALVELAYRERELARAVRLANLGAYLLAARRTAAPALRPPNRPPLPPATPAGDLLPDVPPRLVQVAKAAEWLRTRLDFTPDEFQALDADARTLGFTAARATTLDAVTAIREGLAENVARGETLADFREQVDDALRRTALSPAQVEAVYRTQVGRAYSAGQRAVLDHPLVASEFPYARYSATHDARVRPDHLRMETLGLQGGPIYRMDDPIWDLFWPPWAWRCRCLIIPYSLEDAAAAGVREAKTWLRTGRPPVFPEYVKMPDFRPPKGWVPTGRRLSGVGLAA